MIIDTHTHVVSSDKVKHPLDLGARGWSTEVSNDVEDLIAEMDDAGVECATLVQPNATYALDNTYQCDSANQYAPRTVSVGILDPAAPDAADKLFYWVNEHGMLGVRLQSQAEPDDPSCDAIWQRAEELGVPVSIGGGGQPDKVNRMRNIGARHPDVLFAPDHFAGWSGSQTAQRPPPCFQHQPGSVHRPKRFRERPIQAGNRGLHTAAGHVGLQLPVLQRRRLHRPVGDRPECAGLAIRGRPRLDHGGIGPQALADAAGRIEGQSPRYSRRNCSCNWMNSSVRLTLRSNAASASRGARSSTAPPSFKCLKLS